jgi:glycopeptide antibiotics resistance protein
VADAGARSRPFDRGAGPVPGHNVVVMTSAQLTAVTRRVLAGGACTLYACLGLAVVLLPLPHPGTPRLRQTVQLVPFQWITDATAELHYDGLSPIHAFSTLAFEQAAMNVLLFVPLGIFARILWRRGFAGSLLLGFGVSFAIELTQLTANFGTAPYAYRIFDVDDMITNTSGTVLGWVAATLFVLLRASTSAVGAELPRRERVDLAETR